MTGPLTDAQRDALKALRDGVGEGVIDKHGVVVACGERLPFDAVTWLRLFTLTLVESAGPMRLRLTSAGRTMAQSLR